MPEIKFESDYLKANNNVYEGDFIRFLDAGHFDMKNNSWEFLVGIIPQGTTRVTAQKKFSLNKRNFDAVSKLYGTNSDNWTQKDMLVTIKVVENPKTGENVDAVRLLPISGMSKEAEESIVPL